MPLPDDRDADRTGRRTPLHRYGFAAIAIGGMIFVRLLLDSVLGHQLQYAPVLMGVVLAAWYGGLGPALFAVVLGAVGADYFLLFPRHTLTPHGLDQQLGLLMFGIVGSGIAVLGGTMRRARDEAETASRAERAAAWEARTELNRRIEAEAALRAANAELEEHVRRRTAELSAALESVRTGEAILAGVIQSAMDGIITVDEEQRITHVNPAAEAMFGYTASDLIGRPLERLIPERYRIAHAAHVEKLGPQGVGTFGVFRPVYGRRSDGSEFPIEVSLSRMEVAGRRLYTATLHDITERRRAEAELRTSRAQLVAALEAGGMATWSLDLVANTVQWDDVNLKLWGRSRQQVPDDTIDTALSFLHPDDRHIIEDLKEKTPREQIFARVEYRILLPDGSVRWHASRGHVERDAEGRALRYTGVLLDITDRKQTEDVRLRAQKLEALGTLAGGIAHDFNNILLAISGNTKLAVSDFAADHPVQESLAEISKAATRAAELVKRILSFSRPQDQKREVFQLRPVVEEVLGLLHATMPARIEIRTSFAADLPAIIADSTQIHQIIVNLTTNAADSIAGSGCIELGLDAVSVGKTAGLADLREGRYVRLSVRDSGCGMDKQTLARIFDPFFTTKSAGTGLGLSVVHGIVKSHGGAVAVDSEPGRGTTFSLYFPAVAAAHEHEPAKPREERNGSGQHVLYVDDEDALVALTTRVLKRLGYVPTGFTDPRLALEEFRARPWDFDAVVTDLSMPHIAGFDLARQMLAVRPDLPIVMTSGYLESEARQAAMQIGIKAFILKPDTVEELGYTLDLLLRDRRPQA